MKIYLVRHGEYILNDMEKAGYLSEKGIEDMHRLAAMLKPLKIGVSNILHSGKTRAEQTAKILAEGLVSEEPPQMLSGLNPEDSVDHVIDQIRNWGSDVVIVGHLPFMSRFLGRLVVEDETRELVVFHTGTMVCVEGSPVSNWVIDWVLTPAVVVFN